MYNSIILFTNLLGSIYLCSKSLELINKLFLENKKPPYKIIILNSLVFVVSGSILLFSLNKYKSIKLLIHNLIKID